MQTPIIIKFNDQSSLKEGVYTVILRDLEQQIIGLFDDPNLLMGVRAKLKDALAIVENRHYKVTHPDPWAKPALAKDPIETY